MNTSMFDAVEIQPSLRVSIFVRLLAALAFIVPAIGGALGAFLFVRMFEALAQNQSAGILAVMGGINEATLPVTISLYLAAVIGIVVIIVLAVRMMSETKTASPPSWFFAVGAILGLVPTALFWFAKYMTIEALSPGSSISNTGNIGSVGATVSQIVLLSIISTPIVIVIILTLSVLPFSSRSNTKWLPLAAAIVIEILLISVAVAMPFLINEPKRKNQLVNLPEVRYAEADANIDKQSAMVLTLTADNKLYEKQQADKELRDIIINKGELLKKIEKSMEVKSPDRRIVYLKADLNASFENVVQIFEIIRTADVEKVGLAVIKRKNEDDPYQITSRRIEVKLPQPIMLNESSPNPSTLIATLDKDGKLMLYRNNDMGTISDTKKLEDTLAKIFKDREYNGVFREGTNEVEKTIYLKVSKSVKYGDFIKLVEAVKIAGAEPIGIQIDDLNL